MKVVLSLALVCCYRSPQIGCVFVTVNPDNSVNILSFLLRQFFVFFGLDISVSFLSSLTAFAVSSPFGTLALNSCPFAGAFFSVGRYFLLAIFDGDDSLSNSILRGFLDCCSHSYHPGISFTAQSHYSSFHFRATTLNCVPP